MIKLTYEYICDRCGCLESDAEAVVPGRSIMITCGSLHRVEIGTDVKFLCNECRGELQEWLKVIPDLQHLRTGSKTG